MHALILFAVLNSAVSIPPIRYFQPYPHVKCPPGYSLWWPEGKEFDNDKYAECIQAAPVKPMNTAKTLNTHHKKVERQIAQR